MFDIIGDLVGAVIDLLDGDGPVDTTPSVGGHPGPIHFGSTSAGVSDDSWQEPVSWYDSAKGYFGETSGRPMEPRPY